MDAGYLFAAGSKLIVGIKLPRGELTLNVTEAKKKLTDLATQLSGLPLLRIYWYDGTSSGPTPQQLALAYTPTLKLRLDFVNSVGEQKGVDSLIVTDLIELARNGAMADAILMTGDEDIRVGVQQAQEFGVRVHLVGITPSRDNQSRFLLQEADTTCELALEEVQTFLSRATPAKGGATESLQAVSALGNAAQAIPWSSARTPTPPPNDASTIDTIAPEIAATLRPEEKAAILAESNTGIPRDIDRKLLKKGTQLFGSPQLSSAQKRALRSAFEKACK